MRSGRRNSGSTAAPSPKPLQEVSQDEVRDNRRTRDPSPRENRTLKHVNRNSPRTAVRGLEEQLNELAAAPPAVRQGSLRNILRQTPSAVAKPPSRGSTAGSASSNASPPTSSRGLNRSGSGSSHRRPLNLEKGAVLPQRKNGGTVQAGKGDESFSSARSGSTGALVIPAKGSPEDDFEFDDGKSTPITSDMIEKALLDSSAPSINKLTVLTLSGMHICDIRGLNGLVSLRHLDLSFNRIKQVFGLEALNQLRELRLTCNKITRLDGLQKLTALEDLHVQINRISDIGKGALTNCRKLRSLRIDGNALESLAPHMERLGAVVSLDASSNRLSRIHGFNMMAQLEELNLSFNGISALEGLSAFARLQELNLTANQLESLAGLKGCGQLRVLKVSQNRITDLRGIQRAPLLEELYAASNQLTHCGEVVAAACPNLEFLDVGGNRMSDLNELERIGALRSLIDLKLAGNPMCANELYASRAREHLAAVDTVDEHDFRAWRVEAAQREREEEGRAAEGAGKRGPEVEDASGAVLDRGGVTVGQQRKYKELAEVLSVEEFEAQIRTLQGGILSVRQNLQQEMLRALAPRDTSKPQPRPSEEAQAAGAAKRAAVEARGGRGGQERAGGPGGLRGGAGPAVMEAYERGSELVAQALRRIGKSTWDTGRPPALDTGAAGGGARSPGKGAGAGGGSRAGGEEKEDGTEEEEEEEGGGGGAGGGRRLVRSDYLQSERLAGRAKVEYERGEEGDERAGRGAMPEAVARFNSELERRLAATSQLLLKEVEADGLDQVSPALAPPRSPLPFPLKGQRREEGRRLKQEMEELRAPHGGGGKEEEEAEGAAGGGEAVDGAHARPGPGAGAEAARGRRASDGELAAAASAAGGVARPRPASSRPHKDEDGSPSRLRVQEGDNGAAGGSPGGGHGAGAGQGSGGAWKQEPTEGWEAEFYAADSRPSTSASRLRGDDAPSSRPGSSRVRERLSEARQLAASVSTGPP